MELSVRYEEVVMDRRIIKGYLSDLVPKAPIKT